MSHYTPDQWELIKINGTDPHYRVFGSWSGGYLDGDSWRLNSGVTSVTEDDNYYYFSGSTGSVYQCHKQGYGVRSIHNVGVLAELCEKSQGTAEMVEEMPDVMSMDWII
jgi:hypothetical protein